MYGNPVGLPPLFIYTGEEDELYKDAKKFSHRAKAKGVPVSFRKGKHMVHCYPLMAFLFKEAKQAIDEIICLIHTHLKYHQ